MATMKKAGRDKGKAIRKATGIPLPIAMLMGKRLIRHNEESLKWDVRFAPYLEQTAKCGDISCCGVNYRIAGKRGHFPGWF